MSKIAPRIATRRRLAVAAVALLALLAAGCGGGEGGETQADGSFAGAVEEALFAKGDTQEISCESLGTVAVSGVQREVARCSFTEEKDAAGEMRARGGCFALEEGLPVDVTMAVPAGVSCVTS